MAPSTRDANVNRTHRTRASTLRRRPRREASVERSATRVKAWVVLRRRELSRASALDVLWSRCAYAGREREAALGPRRDVFLLHHHDGRGEARIGAGSRREATVLRPARDRGAVRRR